MSKLTGVATRARKFCSTASVIKRPYLILGIETSCDETGAAVVDQDGNVLGEDLYSQKQVHLKNGGIIPPVAQELHQKHIDSVVSQTISRSNLSPQDLSAVAVTIMPGLSLCLRVGLEYAKRMVSDFDLPLIPVHHMQAHALTARITQRVEFPFLTLLASGGHCTIAVCCGASRFLQLGTKLDDAPGEAFDKIARRLGLDRHPDCRTLSGGAAIELLAQTGWPLTKEVNYPPPLSYKKNCNFSFSGFKTFFNSFILKQIEKHGADAEGFPNNLSDICASVQYKLTHHIVRQLARAMIYCTRHDLLPTNNKTLVLSGGVGSNRYIRQALTLACQQFDYALVCPPPHLCTDNGVMIAWAGMEQLLEAGASCLAPHPQQIRFEPKYPIGEDISGKVAGDVIDVPKIKLP